MQNRLQTSVSLYHEHKKRQPKTLGKMSLPSVCALVPPFTVRWKSCFFFLLLPIILAGCAPKSLTEVTTGTQEPTVVKQKTVDYRWAECSTLSTFYEEGLNNALYWLRTIECSQRLMTTEAQRRANQITVIRWDDAFYKSILLERAGMSIAERRTQLILLESFKLQFPSSMRVLLTTWIDNQSLTLSLAEEKNRSRRISTEMENRVEALKKENNTLEHDLKSTLKKLDSLTQIERQLSSRKQGGSVDSLPADDTTADTVSPLTPNNTEKSAEKNDIPPSNTEQIPNKATAPTTPAEAQKSEQTKPEPTKIEPVKTAEKSNDEKQAVTSSK